jgi:hypothetical protein
MKKTTEARVSGTPDPFVRLGRGLEYPLNYARRCKKKTGHDRHETLHAADNNTTFCGKELNEMWFVESNWGLEPDEVTCKECRRLMRTTPR